MIYLIFFLSFFIFSLNSNGIEKAIQDIKVDEEATSILPPDVIPDDPNPSLGDAQDRIRVLEERVDRLEKLIEILRSSNQSVSDAPKDKASEAKAPSSKKTDKGDPVAEFENIKQLAIQKDPNIENMVNAFREKYKSHPLAAKAYFFLADYYYSQKEYEKAISLIKKGLVEYKDSPEEPRAIWILSLTLSEIQKPDQACVALKKLLSLPSVSVDLRDNATKQIQLLNCK